MLRYLVIMHLVYRIAKFDILQDLYIPLIRFDKEPIQDIYNKTEWEK